MNDLIELRLKAKIFYDKHILVYVKRFNGIILENINGYITEVPSEDFFFISDIKKPEVTPRLVLFSQLEDDGCLFIESNKGVGE